MYDKTDMFLVCLAAIVLSIFAAVFSCSVTQHAIRKDAIKHNVAEWTINKETGEKKFTWIKKEHKNE